MSYSDVSIMGAQIDRVANRTVGPRDVVDISSSSNQAIHMPTLLLIILIVLLLGALPTWPYSAGWGYYPSGGLGLVVLIVLVLLLLGRI
jgi:hypothetical protein